jgi:two-component system LytT family response regulator
VIRALIAEDEPLARRRLVRLLDQREDVEVVGAAKNGEEAVRLIADLTPDLLFLDIHMPELSGFEVLSAIGDAPMPSVIFTTAYDEYALRAFEVHALDYLLKPFDAERLHASVDRAARIASRGAQKFLETMAVPRRFVVRTPGRIVFLPIAEIDFVEAADNYVYLHAGRERHLMRGSLKSLEKQLGPRFKRVHRSAIVNIDAIQEMTSRAHGDYEVVLRSGKRLAASRTYASRLRAAVRP